MKVLDLFAGTGSSTLGFREAGCDVVMIEAFPGDLSHPDIVKADVRDIRADPPGWLDRNVAPGWRPEVIWASPPCTVFSLAGSRGNWIFMESGNRIPKTPQAELGVELVRSAIDIIRDLNPRYWWMENPRAGLRTQWFMRKLPGPVTVTYCQYGDNAMKPTDLWGVWPDSWKPRPHCQNGDPCHDRAPRGSRTGTQGKGGARRRGMVPAELSREIAAACLKEIASCSA